MYSDYSSQQRDKFIYEKKFFLNLCNLYNHVYNLTHPSFFEKFFYYECKLENIYKNTCAFIFL